jgi:8-oxo-dGTP diphosphatase
LTETSPLSYNWVNYVYLSEIQKIDPPTCKEGSLEWIHFDELFHIPTPKTDWHIYRMVLEGKKFVLTAEFNKNLDLLHMFEELEGMKLI